MVQIVTQIVMGVVALKWWRFMEFFMYFNGSKVLRVLSCGLNIVGIILPARLPLDGLS